MEVNENEYTTVPEKKSPYADSPYESAYIAPETEKTQKCSPAAKSRRGRPVLAVLLIVVCCAATGFGVSKAWQNKISRMETAMNEKFDALEQLYGESKNENTSQQLPDQNAQTLGQVYAQNVKAVVVVTSDYGQGSGFLISADGYVVTNYHVVEQDKQVEVTLHSGETMAAEVVGHESGNDIALLKVDGENLPFATIGSSDKLVVGDQVAAIGNPLGELTASLTVGYISAKDRVMDTDGNVINMLQTDAAINAGNSGGPLFNMNGEVVGIITAKYSGSSDSGASIEGLGFAIPTDDVVGILSDLKEFGYVTGAYLGVYVRDVSESAQSYGLPAGAYIEDVIDGYCAKKAGIRRGDIVVNLGGYDVDSVTTLTRVLRRFEAGQSVSVTVYRNGKQEYLNVTLDEKPVQEESSTEETLPVPTPNQGNGNGWFDFFAPFFGIG